MNQVIWISGSINSGKTTVARLLSEHISNAVNIELDLLSSFATNIDIENKIGFIIEDALDLARKWLDRNFLPILNWPIYTPWTLRMINYASALNISPLIITLTPPINIVKQNRGSRELTDWELKRIHYMYQECHIDKPTHGYAIDNSMLTPIQTVAQIITYLDKHLIDHY